MISDYEIGRMSCTDDVVDEIMVAKMLYDQDCFVYLDEDIDRAYPGIIDKSKFTQETYESCFLLLDKKINITIGETTIGEEIFTPKTINKAILLYDEGTVTPTTVSFTFANPTC